MFGAGAEAFTNAEDIDIDDEEEEGNDEGEEEGAKEAEEQRGREQGSVGDSVPKGHVGPQQPKQGHQHEGGSPTTTDAGRGGDPSEIERVPDH